MAAELLEEGRISKAFEQCMRFYNDENGNNMFTLAIESKDTKTILEAMKNLLQMDPDEFAKTQEILPLKDIIK